MKKIKSIILIILSIFIITGCDNNDGNIWLVDSFAPTNSTKGNNGDMYLDTSTYDLYQMMDSEWVKVGNISGKDGINGIDGKDGVNGINGTTPTITVSKDGYWVINGKKTNIKAEGFNGKDGINGIDGKDGVNGKNGSNGKDGVNGKDGINGIDGQTPTVTISEDGYWVINGKKTEVKAECKNCIEQYQEDENIEVPDLYNNMLTPVIYDGNNWLVADVTKKWYDYGDQRWANAVILKNDIVRNIGDIVTVEGENPDTLAMFVWIPRYEYRIQGKYGIGGISSELPGEIEINFIPDYQKESSENYIIHPAFKFGESILNGIWVGKFEVSHSDSTKAITSMNCKDENCSEGNNLRVLPNVKSLRNNTISSFFYGIRSMSKENNIFGINSNITNTHMMKNSEWGAVSYLSQSKYGKYGNSDYVGLNKEVYVNNSSGFYTGRSGGSTKPSSSTNGTYKYNEEKNGTGASTTGNIYGIYDMSGGAWEYTMGVFANSNGELWSGKSITENSGFKGKVGTAGTNITGLEWPNEKYYNVFKASSGTSISASTSCNGGICYGYALSETADWYGDYPYLVSAQSPWFTLGGGFGSGSNAGMFRSGGNSGSALDRQSTHVILVSNK